MREKPTPIPLMFDKISPTYDAINRILSFGLDRFWRKKMVRFLPKKEGLELLDLATGTGDQLFSLCEHAPSVQSAIGIDLAEKMLEIGQKKLGRKPYRDKVRLLKGDAGKIPFSAHTFDLVTISFGIRNVPDVETTLREIHRVLRPQGKCLILEFSLPENSLVRFCHLSYLRHVLPRVGGLLSKSPASYRYLNQTIECFPYGDAFLRLMANAGFQKSAAHPFTLGAVTLYEGEKL